MPNNKESLKEEFIEEFFTDVGFTSKVYTFKVFCDNPDKIYDFFTSHFSQTIDKVVEEIGENEKADDEVYEISGAGYSQEFVDGFNQALSLAKGIILKGKEILK